MVSVSLVKGMKDEDKPDSFFCRHEKCCVLCQAGMTCVYYIGPEALKSLDIPCMGNCTEKLVPLKFCMTETRITLT
ncbi:MAG: hypothetical protein ACQEQO_02100 [Thermodesulfobacteriota bacterium]